MGKPKSADPAPVAYSYIRFSTPGQAEGDSLRRQTDAAVGWCGRNGVRLDTSTTLHDLGRSAYTGTHRKNPDRHALAAFLKLVEQNRVPRGSYLIVENLDRLSREHIRPALTLLLNLIEAGVRVVQLIPVEAVYDENVEPMQLMMAIMELSRGNSESRVKSVRNGAAWDKMREAARTSGKVVTGLLPAWVERHGDGLRLVPGRGAVVKRIFALAAAGFGQAMTVRKLIAEGVPPFTGGQWSRSYVNAILADRRAVGEFRPRHLNGTPAGDPIPDYYPAAVSDADWLAAREGAAQRRHRPGRVGRRVNLFAGLVRDARGTGNYCCVSRTANGKKRWLLMTSAACEGRAKCYSYPADVFEAAVLSQLREVNPAEVLGREDGPDEVSVLAGLLAQEDAAIAELEAELLQGGHVATLAKVLRQREANKAELVAKLAEARQRRANPLAESWGEAITLIDVLAGASDPVEARLRMRAALRRIVSEMTLLVVPRGRTRVAAVQVWFAGDDRHRDYLIVSTPTAPCGGSASRKTRPGQWWVRSFAEAGVRDIDLRRAEDVAAVAAELAELDLAELDS